MKKVWLLSLLALLHAQSNTYAQINLETFGKNRVNRKVMDWRYYESKRFRVHYYDRGGSELAKYVIEQADKDLRAVEKTMNSYFPQMLNVIIYNNYDDYLESNVNFRTELEISDDYAGNLKIVGDKLVVYFNGKHTDFKNQLRKGFAKVMIERAMYGDDIKEIARNAFKKKIPTWVGDGYVDYLVFGWNSDSEEELKQIVQSNKKVYFEDIVRNNATLAGKMFWKYINDKKGTQEVKNLFVDINSRNNVNKSLKAKYSIKQNAFNDSMIQYFKSRYEFESQLTENPITDSALFVLNKNNDDVTIKEITVSPRGNNVAYVEWKNGEYRVLLERTTSGNQSKEEVSAKIMTGGLLDFTAENDVNYPLLAWSNTGFKLGVIYPKFGKLWIKVYDAVKGKQFNYEIKHNRFDRIQSFTFMEDDDMLVLSAIKNGQSDLYEYRYKTGRFTQLTNDTYDDLNPLFVTGGLRKGIAFLSNRPLSYINIKALPNELPAQPLNGYFYNYTTKRTELLQLSKEDKNDIQKLINYGPDHFAYLSDKSGIKNRYVVLFNRDANNMDTAYSVPMTNYSSNIISQQYNPASQKIAEVIQENKKYKIYFRNLDFPAPVGNAEVKDPIFIKAIEQSLSNYRNITDSNVSKELSKSNIDLKETEDFYTEFDKTSDKESASFAEQINIKPSEGENITNLNIEKSELDSLGRKILYVDSTFIKMRSTPYLRNFHISSLSASLDNSLVFTKYQSYSGNYGKVNNPDLAGMTTIALRDRLENHRITGGLRLNPDLSSAYFVKYENLTRRIDWGFALFQTTNKFETQVGLQQGSSIIPFNIPTKTKLSIVQANVAYPIDRTKRIGANIGLRFDNSVLKASEAIGLVIPNLTEQYLMGKIEYVQDNTKTPALNIYNGFRGKIFGEYFYKYKVENELYADANGNVNNKKGGFYNVGFDMRYYHKIYKEFIFAVRAAGAHSGGDQQILYTLGGVDNGFAPKYNEYLQSSLNNTYAFQSLSTNLRGYPQNSRNGNTYVVLNAELRLPLITTFTRKSVNNLFLKNLQLITFVDAGSAWEGLFPDDNLVRNNTFYYPNRFDPQVVVNVPYVLPSLFASSVGAGLRMYIYSYFIRIDYAKSIQKNTDPMLHISLGYDF